MGHEVVLVDVDPAKIQAIATGQTPIYEPGLEDLIRKNRDRISATQDLRAAIESTDITFVAVGTPSQDDGAIDLSYILTACEEIGQALRNKEMFHTVIIKSTVFPGTTKEKACPVLERASGKMAGKDFGIGSNPEFLREGSAVRDCLSPDRVVIGADDSGTADILRDLYAPLGAMVLVTPVTTAEMIKYTSNAVLAAKVSLANELGNLCKRLGVDSREVFTVVGMDSRVSPAFFRTGIGFGGSCFPKDVRALVAGARVHGEDLKILRAVLEVNEEQPKKVLSLL
jgi:UDPglucose 6-dehydrogenase